MPATIWERAGSRASNVTPTGAAIDLDYIVHGTDDDQEARDLIEATAPATFRGMTRQSYQIKQIGPDIWEAGVKYDRRETREAGTHTTAFDTTGGTQHVNYSLFTSVLGTTAGVAESADFKRAINVTKDGIDGTDIIAPQLQLVETHYLADTTVTDEYVKRVRDFTGTVNNAAWRGWEEGEVLFMGARGAKRGTEDWEITFTFNLGKNQTGLTIAGSTPFDKKAWEYLWVYYVEAVDPVAKCVVRKPKYFYVEQVYHTKTFELLEIGS